MPENAKPEAWTWTMPNDYSECPSCGRHRIRVSTNYHEPFIHCDHCKRGAFLSEWQTKK